jgi:hypothetical protein
MLSFPTTAAASQVSADSLVGYWKLDELSAGTASDASGEGNTGTGQGAGGANNKPQPSTDVASGFDFSNTRSMNFDGTDDHVNVGTATLVSDTSEVTFTAWIRLNTVAGGTMVIVTNCDTNGVKGIGNLEINRSAGKLSAISRDYNSILGHSNTTLATGVWYHVAKRISGSPGAWTHTIYLNGVENGSFADSTNPQSGGVRTTSIGNLQGTSVPNFFSQAT